MPKKDIAQELLKDLESKYQATKKGEAESLHNDIGQIIDQHKPDAQTLLFVLEMVRYECLSQKFGELFIKGGRAPLDIKAEQ